MEGKLYNLKMQILREKGISDWLKKELAEQILQIEKELAINYSRCCKSDSDLLVLFADWLQYNGKWSTTEQQVKDFLKEQQEQN